MKKCIIVIIALIYSFLGVQMLFADTTPNQFKFTAKTKADLNTVYTSNTITVSGINAPAPISIVGGTYSIKGGPYTGAPGTVMNGNTVNVQQTSAGSFSTKTDATLTIGGVFATFSVTTVPADTEPKNFKFTDQKNVPLSTPITSNTITVSGINTAAPISIVGGEYSINGGSYTGAYGTVNNTDTVTVQQTSSASFSTMTMATLTIGGVSDTFGVKTVAADPKPDKFIFTPQTGVELSQVITSNAITVSGINTAAPISIVGGTYSIGGGPYISAPGTVNNNDTVTVQQTSSGDYNKTTVATLTIGKVKGKFSVKTKIIFTQADLTGTWRLSMLRQGYKGHETTPRNGWERGRISIDSSGNVTCLSYITSKGDTSCPVKNFGLKLTMHKTGVITESGDNADNLGSYLTMTANKNLIAGTGTGAAHNGGHNNKMSIAQKEVNGTTYSAADLQSQSLVYHQLRIIMDNTWIRGAGNTDASGKLSLSEIDALGTNNPLTDTGSTLSVDSNGVVTMSPDSGNFEGFLSDDKKTIVATHGHEGGAVGDRGFHLMVIQITGTEFTVGYMPAGISVSHMFGTYTGGSFWVHNNAIVAPDGSMTFTDWVFYDTPVVSPTGPFTGNITDTSGTLTIDGIPTYHGQISHDEEFSVATQTPSAGAYMLIVDTVK